MTDNNISTALRLSKQIYKRRAIKQAADSLSEAADIRIRHEKEYTEVEFFNVDHSVKDIIAGEFENFCIYWMKNA